MTNLAISQAQTYLHLITSIPLQISNVAPDSLPRCGETISRPWSSCHCSGGRPHDANSPRRPSGEQTFFRPRRELKTQQISSCTSRWSAVPSAASTPGNRGKAPSIKCKNVWVRKNASLSCLSGMTRESVLHRHERALLTVTRKGSLPCGLRKTWQPQNLSCVAAYCGASIIHF